MKCTSSSLGLNRDISPVPPFCSSQESCCWSCPLPSPHLPPRRPISCPCPYRQLLYHEAASWLLELFWCIIPMWSSGPQGPMPCSLLQHMHAWDQLLPESRTLWVGNQTIWEWLQCSGRTEWREEVVVQKRACWVLRAEGQEAGRSGVLFVKLQRRFWKAFFL